MFCATNGACFLLRINSKLLESFFKPISVVTSVCVAIFFQNASVFKVCQSVVMQKSALL